MFLDTTALSLVSQAFFLKKLKQKKSGLIGPQQNQLIHFYTQNNHNWSRNHSQIICDTIFQETKCAFSETNSYL